MNYVTQLMGENEQIVLRARQSWVVLIRSALENFLIALALVTVAVLWQGASADNRSYWILLLLLLPVGRFMLGFIHWLNREYIVTNRRVVQVDGAINKNVIDSSLEKVNDVRMSQSIIGRMLDYGDIEILTASELGINRFQRIGDPIKFKTAMLNEKEKLGYEENPLPAPVAAPAPTEITVLLAQLNALYKEGLITADEFAKKKAELLARM
ncbi:MAG: hypothetical protein B6D41_04855 [Chloroflexi bacterium UTCFX4]|jgi:uncharacterized membrane protein YdbT with pleckstrin-like domain|nr:MAG: hypothetical protein B6D41_04855 [Chloroflexi bacterium UTCFX4]